MTSDTRQTRPPVRRATFVVLYTVADVTTIVGVFSTVGKARNAIFEGAHGASAEDYAIYHTILDDYTTLTGVTI